MQRRAIILALGAATSPMVGHAQRADKLGSSLRVGLAGYLTNFSSAQNAFLQRLAELGFVEGRNLSFNSELTFLPNLDAAYADMVKDGVDILLAFCYLNAVLSLLRNRSALVEERHDQVPVR